MPSAIGVKGTSNSAIPDVSAIGRLVGVVLGVDVVLSLLSFKDFCFCKDFSILSKTSFLSSNSSISFFKTSTFLQFARRNLQQFFVVLQLIFSFFALFFPQLVTLLRNLLTLYFVPLYMNKWQPQSQ